MAYTYLITGATSDVGAALIRRLLTEAPGEDRTILAQGCGDLARCLSAAIPRPHCYP